MTFAELRQLVTVARRSGFRFTPVAISAAATHTETTTKDRGKFLRGYKSNRALQKQRCRELLVELREGIIGYLRDHHLAEAGSIGSHDRSLYDDLELAIEAGERMQEITAELRNFDSTLIEEMTAALDAEAETHLQPNSPAPINSSSTKRGRPPKSEAENNDYRIIGRHIRAAAKRAGYKQSTVAAELGLPLQTVGRHWRGEASQLACLSRYADCLRVTVGSLLVGVSDGTRRATSQ